MNAREEARRMAEVMLAFADGADVQLRLHDGGPWSYTGAPGWDWGTWDYRVKPSPREEWRVVDKYGNASDGYANAVEARRHADCCERNLRSLAPFRIVHMREVTE